MSGVLFQVFLLFALLIGIVIYLKDMLLFVVILELLIISFIQSLKNVIKLEEFYFLFVSSILFLFIFIFLKNNINYNVNSASMFLIFYINWYYFTYIIVNLVN